MLEDSDFGSWISEDTFLKSLALSEIELLVSVQLLDTKTKENG